VECNQDPHPGLESRIDQQEKEGIEDINQQRKEDIVACGY